MRKRKRKKFILDFLFFENAGKHNRNIRLVATKISARCFEFKTFFMTLEIHFLIHFLYIFHFSPEKNHLLGLINKFVSYTTRGEPKTHNHTYIDKILSSPEPLRLSLAFFLLFFFSALNRFHV